MSDRVIQGCSCSQTFGDSGTVRRQLCCSPQNDRSGFSVGLPVHQLVADRALLRPDAVAVAQDDILLTYAELDDRAENLAHELKKMGVGLESPVGLMARHSPEMVVAVLAVLKAGGAYVPLGTDLPPDRVAFIAADIGMRVALADEDSLGLFSGFSGDVVPLGRCGRGGRPVGRPVGRSASGAGSANLAYVMYTSGSTGRPKGVAVEHAGLSNYVQWLVSEFSGGGPVNSFLHTPITFDFSLTSLCLPLVTGGRLVLPPRGYGNEDLADALQMPGLDLVRLTPSHVDVLTTMLDGRSALPGPKVFVIGGEILRARHVTALRRLFPRTVIYNHYGPTETVVGRCFLRLDGSSGFDVADYGPEDPLPVGGPIPNTRIAIDYANSREAADGVGELLISGTGIARGYVNLPEATERSFIPAPGHGGRMYRSGDLVRLDAKHRPIVVGRADGQVKVRGHRVEPGEVEALIREVDGVRAVAVLPVQPPRDGLAAFVVAPANDRPEPARLRAALARSIPPYMVPQYFVFVDELPLTPHSKLDRPALQELLNYRLSSHSESSSAPDGKDSGGHLMATMCELWEMILGVEGVRPADNFIALGGDSISAMKLAAACKRRGIVVRSVRFLSAASLAEMCEEAGLIGTR